MNIRKSFEAWFLREYGDGNFSRLESGEYADLAVRNYWGIWKGAWAALGEQQPAVQGEPVAWIVRHPHFCGKFTDDKEIAAHWESKKQGCTTPLFHCSQPAEQRPAVPEGWQPMETAPKDGTRILLRTKDGGAADGQWVARAYAGNGAWVWPFIHREPTHWMPLPVLLSAQPAEQQPDVTLLLSLLSHARCNTCDGSGGLYDGHGQVLQCQWCHDRSAALAAHRKQGGEA